VAERREREVMELAKSIWDVRSRRLVGRTFRALVVAPGVARLASQAPDVDGVTYIEDRAEVGEFVDVRIVRVKGFDLVAKVSRAARPRN
jgi:tRNA A37 methylthiotransferase MiaB